jgi:hypothetical protein
MATLVGVDCFFVPALAEKEKAAINKVNSKAPKSRQIRRVAGLTGGAGALGACGVGMVDG